MGLFKILKESYLSTLGPKKCAKDNLDNVSSEGFKLDNNINGLEGKDMKYYSRFQSKILGSLKYMFFYPTIMIVDKYFSKYHFRKAPEGFAFRNIKADDLAWNKALVKWYDLYLQDLTWKSPVKKFKVWLLHKNFTVLKSVHEFKMTMVLSDSAYFEFYNIYLLELYKEMGIVHGEQPVHVLYKEKRFINDPIYFVAVREGVDVVLKQRLQTLKPYYDKNGNLKAKFVGGSLSYTIDSLAVELNCVPKRDVLIAQIRSLKQQNIILKQSLIDINQVTVQGLGVKVDASKEVKLDGSS